MLTLFSLLTAVPAVLALHLLEPELVLPAFSALLFVEAAFAVIAARLIHSTHSADDIDTNNSPAYWDIVPSLAQGMTEPVRRRIPKLSVPPRRLPADTWRGSAPQRRR